MSRSRLVALLLMCVALPVALLIVAAQGDKDSGATEEVTITTPAPGPSSTVDITDLPKPGSAAPQLALESLDGETVSLAGLRGRPVVLTFFASWCHPCEQEFPLLERARIEHKDDGLAVIGVAYNDREADTRDFVERKGVHFPALLDPDGAAARAFRVGPGIPVTFFIAADGQIVERGFGLTQRKHLDPLLAKLLDN